MGRSGRLNQAWKEQRARDALEFDPLPSSTCVSISRNGISVTVPNCLQSYRFMRKIPFGHFDHRKNEWTFPFSASDEIRNILDKIENIAAKAQVLNPTTADQTSRHTVKAPTDNISQAQIYKDAERPLRQEFLKPADGTIVHLALEAIGDNLRRIPASGFRSRNWVAQISGASEIRGHPRMIRTYLPGNADYRTSNSIGSRGITVSYWLSNGLIYEVSSPQSWTRTERYFVRYAQGQPTRMTRDEVLSCLEK